MPAMAGSGVPGVAPCGSEPSRASVYGCRGAVEDDLRGRLLDRLAGVHHEHVVGQPGHDAPVVGDQQHGDLAGQLQRPEQREDVGLDRHVQGRGRLVGHQDLRVAGQGPGDGHPLRHATRDLVRVQARHPLRIVDPDPAEQGDGALPGLLAPAAGVGAHDLGERRADRLRRVEAGHRLLADERDPAAADAAPLRLARASQFGAVELDAAGDPAARRRDAEEGAGRDGLAAAGLAHDRQRPPGDQVEADPADQRDVTGRARHVDAEVAHLEHSTRCR